MKWQKSPGFLVQAFEHCLPIIDGVERRPMFGYPCAFFNGHLFCGLHAETILVRLSERGRQAVLAEGGHVFEPAPGKPMEEYVVLAPEVIADRQRLRALLSDALAHVSSLAPEAHRPETAEGPGVAKAAKKPAPKASVAPAKKAVRKARAATAKKAPAPKKAKKAAPAGRAKAAKAAASQKPASRKKGAPRPKASAKKAARPAKKKARKR